MKITKHAKLVEEVLTYYPVTRNNNEKFVARVYQLYIVRSGLLIDDALRLMFQNKLPKIESITRCKRLLQEQNPKLAGNKKRRLEEAENVKKEVRNYKLKT